jgi:putative hemolysin
MTPTQSSTTFRLADRYRRSRFRFVLTVLDRILGLERLAERYERLPLTDTPEAFLTAALDELGVRISVAEEDLERIPRSGSVIVVANHPFGGLEGMALALLLSSVRSDVKVLANFILGEIGELGDLLILVDPFGGRESASRSLRGLRSAHDWLRKGGLLLTFPAGEVAHLDLRQRRVTDPPWNPAITRLARRAQAAVVPIYVSGRNGVLFQLAGLLHPSVRTALLPRQLMAHEGRKIEFRIGRTCTSRQLGNSNDELEATKVLRRSTEVLAARKPPVDTDRRSPVQPRRTPASPARLISPIAPVLLEAEVEALSAEQLLIENGDQVVIEARADQIPQLLTEIGRLREQSFRDVGEGTGRDVDLDLFDQNYRHLFIWNRSKREVIGAYRIGFVDQLLDEHGLDGIYTSTLFRFSPKLFRALGPSLELGRSFIRTEYQKSFAGLLLLWKGIGRFVLNHPRHSTLFGPVSISSEYHSVSQQLLAAFLSQNNFVHPCSKWVKPRMPFRARTSVVVKHGLGGLRTLDEASRCIAEIEADGKGVPILIKQYLKLGGKLLGFNVDPAFSHVLDVLIAVDLRMTDQRVLARLMGREEAEDFLSAGKNLAEALKSGTGDSQHRATV